MSISAPSLNFHKRFVVIVFLTSGIITTFAYKLQGSQIVKEGNHNHKIFFHPYMQCMSMFVGEALCLIVYLMQGKKGKLSLEAGKSPHRPWIFFIPAFSDALSSMLQYIGLAFLAGSTYMMFKGASIVTTAIFSKILVNMKIQKRHITGCGMAILGLVIVGAAGFLDTEQKGHSSTFQKQLLGDVIMLISLIFNGFFFAYEQKLMKNHTINPLEMVGFQGCFGVLIMTVIIAALSFTPCTFNEDCVFDDNNNAFMELPWVFFREVAQSWILLLLLILGIITIALFNFSGASITKLFDALTRSLLSVTKTAAIWIIGIIITVCATTEQYKLESTNIGVNLLKAVGFAVIIVGTLIYNQLILKKYFDTDYQKQNVLLEEDQIVSAEDLGVKSNIR